MMNDKNGVSNTVQINQITRINTKCLKQKKQLQKS